VAAPIASSSGLVNRTLSAISGKDSSANSHRTKFHQGVHEMAVHPLGAGLGTVGGVGQSLDPFGGVTAEDYYLQVGDELGIHTLVGFALLTVLLLVALRRSIDGSPGMAASGGAWLGGVALAVGAFLLHVWAGLVISLCFWTFAGAVIGIADIRRLEDAVRTTASALPAPSARRRELARG
ncbi:MAG TPA: hypothetical protein VNY84_14925, partial [Acidimicrobiales bacterium]|nr:hypothetical protein [Acidimicrobiales bacterium]